jgi:hypothetical protein
MALRQLFRPVGLFELGLIAASGYAAFPPRLPHQPIFYPVLTVDYAAEIASKWNTVDAASGFMGAVTAFQVDSDYLAQFSVQVVGSADHRELWIPADKLAEFNAHIEDVIQVVAAFYGEAFTGERTW